MQNVMLNFLKKIYFKTIMIPEDWQTLKVKTDLKILHISHFIYPLINIYTTCKIKKRKMHAWNASFGNFIYINIVSNDPP